MWAISQPSWKDETKSLQTLRKGFEGDEKGWEEQRHLRPAILTWKRSFNHCGDTWREVRCEVLLLPG